MKQLGKSLSLLGMAGLLALTAAACQSAPAPSASSPAAGGEQAPAAKPENATLRFSWWGSENRHKALLSAIELYMQKNPHVKIEPEYGGFDGYYQKLVTQFAGGTAPDLTPLSYDWIDEIAVKGDLVLDLNTQKEHINLQAFDAEFLQKYTTFNNKLVGLPMGLNGMVGVTNKDFFKKHNIPEDTVWDWKTLHEIGKRVHQEDKNDYLLSSLDYRGFLQPYVNQLSGNQWIKDDYTLGFDRAMLQDALTYYKSLLDDGVMQPVSESSLYPDISTNPLWLKGNLGIVFSLSSTITRLQANVPNVNVTMYPIPQNAKTSGVLVNPSNPLAINKATKHPAEAAKFASWLLTDPEAAKILLDVYSIPAVENNAKTLAEQNLINPLVTKGVELAMQRPGDPLNGISGNKELSQITEDLMQQVAFGKLSPEQAAEQLSSRLTDKLKTLK